MAYFVKSLFAKYSIRVPGLTNTMEQNKDNQRFETLRICTYSTHESKFRGRARRDLDTKHVYISALGSEAPTSPHKW